MKIVVFDVPAVSGGALTILTKFYQEIIDYKNDDIEWVFILSTPKFEQRKNIKIENYPWIKRSWFHRLFFEFFVTKKILKKHKPDKILSLQNLRVNTSIKQIVYLHQALPFNDYKFKLKENKTLWVYQNIISKLIYCSIKKADKIIVQAEWMKKKCINRLNINENIITVVPPFKIRYRTKSYNPDYTNIFFYPASFLEYKNHSVIFKALMILNNKTDKPFKLILTIDEKDIKPEYLLYYNVELSDLPIEFIGKIPKEEVIKYYVESTLIFPSYIETIGLPLLEAQEYQSIIIAADELFAREVLNEYENAYFFDKFDAEKLADYMKRILEKEIVRTKPNFKESSSNSEKNLIDEVIKF